MLKKVIKYENFDGKEVEGTFYFNLTEAEVAKLELSVEGGLSEFLDKIVKEMDKEKILNAFEMIILKSYGVKSEDGLRFIKSEQLSLEFSQTAAYSALFVDMVTNPGEADAFIEAVIPKKFAKMIAEST